MHQLLPEPGDVDPVEAYLDAPRPRPAGRPWFTVGMITSLDGATAVDGRSGELGGPADQAVLRAVRAVADVVLVGAGTVRAEGYGAVRIADDVRAARAARGRSTEPPRLAIVSGRLGLDPDAPVFRDAAVAPVVFTTTGAYTEATQALESVAEVRAAGTDGVDLAAVAGQLAAEGAGVVVAEGGPHLNGALADAGLVDELCLTISPRTAGGTSARIVDGAEGRTRGYELASLLTEDDLLFGRWVRR